MAEIFDIGGKDKANKEMQSQLGLMMLVNGMVEAGINKAFSSPQAVMALLIPVIAPDVMKALDEFVAEARDSGSWRDDKPLNFLIDFYHLSTPKLPEDGSAKSEDYVSVAREVLRAMLAGFILGGGCGCKH